MNCGIVRDRGRCATRLGTRGRRHRGACVAGWGVAHCATAGNGGFVTVWTLRRGTPVRLAPDVWQIRARGCSVTVLSARGEVTLVDAGARGSLPRISRGLATVGLKLEGVRHVVLTHYHPDHTGGLGELVRATGADVAAHESEADIYSGNAPAPNPFRWWPQAMAVRPFLRFAYGARVNVAHRLRDGDRVPWMDDVKVVHTPGHTAGSICLHIRPLRTLIVGDALQYRFGRLSGPARAVTQDHALAMDSIRRLARLDIDVIGFSHYSPLRPGATRSLEQLVRKADRR